MSASNPTYNVDTAYLGEKWTHLVFEGEDVNTELTDTRVDGLIATGAARLNGVLLAAFPGFDLTTITAADYPVAYNNARDLIRALIGPELLTAAHHTLGLEAARFEKESAEDRLKQILKHPASFGLPIGTKTTPRAATHVQALSLDTATAARRQRRMWDEDDVDKVRW